MRYILYTCFLTNSTCEITLMLLSCRLMLLKLTFFHHCHRHLHWENGIVIWRLSSNVRYFVLKTFVVVRTSNLDPVSISRQSSRAQGLLWSHNGRDSVSNTSLAIVYSTVYSDPDKKTSKLRVTGLCVWGIHRGPVLWSFYWIPCLI